MDLIAEWRWQKKASVNLDDRSVEISNMNEREKILIEMVHRERESDIRNGIVGNLKSPPQKEWIIWEKQSGSPLLEC